MSKARCQVRLDDAEAVADLAAGLAQSFAFSRSRFRLSYLGRVLMSAARRGSSRSAQ